METVDQFKEQIQHLITNKTKIPWLRMMKLDKDGNAAAPSKDTIEIGLILEKLLTALNVAYKEMDRSQKLCFYYKELLYNHKDMGEELILLREDLKTAVNVAIDYAQKDRTFPHNAALLKELKSKWNLK